MPLLEAAAELTGARPLTLADGGYHGGANLAAVAATGQVVAMPESQPPAVVNAPYHKDRFAVDAGGDRLVCPEGHALVDKGLVKRTGRPDARRYRAEAAAICRACPAFGVCTTNARQGRTLELSPHETALRQHRAWMASAAARDLSARRKTLPEPVFGVIKERQGGRRLLTRGLHAVQAEWQGLALGFNLRTLARLWRANPARVTRALAAGAAG